MTSFATLIIRLAPSRSFPAEVLRENKVYFRFRGTGASRKSRRAPRHYFSPLLRAAFINEICLPDRERAIPRVFDTHKRGRTKPLRASRENSVYSRAYSFDGSMAGTCVSPIYGNLYRETRYFADDRRVGVATDDLEGKESRGD